MFPRRLSVGLRSFFVEAVIKQPSFCRFSHELADRTVELQVDKPDECLKDRIRSFQMKSARELLRTWLILKLSSINSFVDHSEMVLKTTRTMLNKSLFDTLLKATFYGQFAGGETLEDLRKTVDRLKKSGIRSMLCIPIETTGSENDSYETREKIWNMNTDIIKECIDVTDEIEKRGYSQIKLTALCGQDLLLNMNKYLIPFECGHHEPEEWNIGRIGNLLKAERYEEITIPYSDSMMNLQLRDFLKRIDTLAKACQEKGLKMMIDAEQTYIQSALGFLVLVLQHKYNTNTPVVYNTYQCYRKDTLARVTADYNLSKENNFKIAAKLVRGAYMDEERRIASEQGIADPINDDFDKTTEMYHSVFDYMLSLVKSKQAGMMIASHNESTVLYALQRLNEMELSKHDENVCFAQLYGMCDHITEGLATMGLQVFKSVPYGEIDGTLLYLTRRAKENKSVMERTAEERRMILTELLQRTGLVSKSLAVS